MPYTPPSQHSPASSKHSSPSVSRSPSWHEQDVPRSPVTGRPQLPRSHSSSSYLHKHRRSPSFQKSEAPPTPTEAPESVQDVPVKDASSISESVRQSPPPVNNLLIPTGAVISPPDSSENSGDEGAANVRGRELEKKWDLLQEAVRGIDQKREGSPDKVGMHRKDQRSSAPVSGSTSPTALTPEARKISHSRSSTAESIIIPRQTKFAESPTNSSDESDEDEPLHKPSLVRKKSGELVKPALRPSSRRRYSSMPGTPTYSKSVHFNEDENQTRHFLQVDKPMAVSAGSSPVETYESESEYPFDTFEREIRLANFPADTLDRKVKPVRVERLWLSLDKQTLIGKVAVQNIAFHKLVVARFTFDHWKTTSEVVAEYSQQSASQQSDGCDRFDFNIKLSDSANVDEKTLLLCVRYNVGTQEFWDNNSDSNYHIDFNKVPKQSMKPASSLGARPVGAIPKSRHNPSRSLNVSRGRQESVDDDFYARFDNSSAYSFGAETNILGEGGSIKLKPRNKRGSIFPGSTAAQQPANNGLGGRYDFGASLSAALTSAQDKLGRESGLMGNKLVPKPNTGYFGLQERSGVPAKVPTPDDRPDALTTDRPAIGSDQYRDLVQKFCYFTPSAGKVAATPSTVKTAAAQPSTTTQAHNQAAPTSTDGAVDDGDNDNASFANFTAGKTGPPAAVTHQHLDSTIRGRLSASLSPFVMSRSTSPAAPKSGQGIDSRSASPLRSFGYPYHYPGGGTREANLSDSPTLTAICG